MLENNKRLNLKYEITAATLHKQFETIFNELQKKLGGDNPIVHLKYRIKSPDSIKEKMIKYLNNGKLTPNSTNINYIFTVEEVEENVDDLVGYRIVCPFLSDVYKVQNIIKDCTNIEIIDERNYIKNPKKSGYSSYHLKVLVPIRMPGNEEVEKVKAEIQIRTITMDMLASLEHKIKYKKNVELPTTMQTKLTKTVRYCNYIDKDLDNVLLEERKKTKKKKEQINLPAYVASSEYKNFLENNVIALKKIKDKLNSLESEELSIEHIKYRIKDDKRIVEKLKRNQIPVTFANTKEYINDIAGVRIVCPFLDDVQKIIELIQNDETLEVIETQDYVTNPKESGYTSYHMLVNVPIMTEKGLEYNKVEIQIRTMAQEMWAILQERLCYQKETDKSIADNLIRLSTVLTDVDYNMNEMIKYSRAYQKKNKKKKLSI